jgi:hypothetical protein
MKDPLYRLKLSQGQRNRIRRDPEYLQHLIEMGRTAGKTTALARSVIIKAHYASGRMKKRFGSENCMARREVVLSMIRAVQRKPNGLETKFINLFSLNGLPIEYVGNGRFLVQTSKGWRCPDFKVIGKNKLIEVGSPPWHDAQDFRERVQLFGEAGFECKTFLIENSRDLQEDEVIREVSVFVLPQ